MKTSCFRASFAAVAVVIITTLMFVVPKASAAEWTDDDRSYVAQNCSSIQISLKNLQVSDANTRAYLGNILEGTTTRYITRLNVRLIRNNISVPDLIRDQSDITAVKAAFSASYVKYARSLEDLIKINCRTNPQGFLSQLVVVRTNRAALHDVVEQTKSVVTTHIDNVEAFKESL